jgi:proliferating cell nuclear antigen PCNA
MKLVPIDSSLFRNAVEALKDFLPVAQLRLSTNGLNINGMDSSHVGFVDYFLAAADCKTFDVHENITLGINMTVLARALSAVGQDDELIISDNKNQDKLVISYTNKKVGKQVKFEVPLMDISDDALNLPEMDYDGSITLKTIDIAAVIKEVAGFGEALTFKMDSEGLHIRATGDAGSVCQTLTVEGSRVMKLKTDSVEAAYGTKYMAAIMKGGVSLANVVTIDFDGSQPLRATFLFGKDKGSRFVNYLAPKVMDD